MFNLFRKDPRPQVHYRDHNAILKNITPHFRIAKPERAKAFLLWADSFGPIRDVAEQGKRLKKPVIVVQHGRASVREYLPPLNYQPIADKICVWGPRDKDMMLKAGYGTDRIVLTGAPIFDGIKTERIPHEGTNVLFAPLHWDSEMDENPVIYEKLASIKGVSVTTKLLQKSHDISRYGKNVVVTTQKDPELLDKIFNLMKRTDIVVTNGSGTFDLIAMYFNIPVIFIDNFKPRSFLDTDEKTISEFVKKYGKPKAVDYTKDLGELGDLIKLNIERPDRLKAEREKELLDCAAIGLISDPVDRIVKLVTGEIERCS